MLSPDLTTTTATYALVSSRATSSVRADATQPLDEPNLVTISHETQNNGKVSSVIIFDDDKNVSSETGVTPSRVRLQFKLQYNPSEGRTALTTDINALLAQLIEVLGDAATVAKFLNKEH